MKLFFLSFVLIFVGSCSHSSFKFLSTSTTPKTAASKYKAALSSEKSGRYIDALRLLKSIKSEHPYSAYVSRSELKIADVLYKQENWKEAESAYKFFNEFHPKTRPAYVNFQLAMSIYKQAPSAIDRDISSAKRSLSYFYIVFRKYSKSAFYKKSALQIKKITDQLAEKEYYIAQFYFKRKNYKSALIRYERLLKIYVSSPLKAKAMYGAAISAARTKNKRKARRYLRKLRKLYRKTVEYRKAKREIKK